MEFVLLEGALVALTVLEVLGALAVEHAVVPVALVLPVPAFPVQHSPTCLHAVPEISLIPAAVRPPEGPASISLAAFELSLVDVALLAGPGVYTSALFLVEAELSHVIVSSGKVELSLSFQLTVVEVTVDDLVSVFEEADTFAVGSVDLGFSDVNYFWVFEEFRSVEGGFRPQNQRRAVLDDQKFLQF
jgi:hypothetical protein